MRRPACTAAPIAFGLLTSAVRRGSRVDAIDCWLSDLVTARRSGRLVDVGRVATLLGSRSAALLTAAVADALVAHRRSCPRVPPALAVVLTGMAAREQLSQAVARRRPPTDRWLVRPHGYSYPSRHATAAALGLSVLARSLPQSRRLSGRAVAAGLTGAVGASRVYLGVHWSTDVVGAWLFAASWLAAVDAVERTFWRLAPDGWPPVKGLR